MNEMTLTPEKLDEIERLAERATPGPWELRDADNGPHIVARLPENEGKRWDDPVICNLYGDVTPEDSVTIGPWLETLPNALANAQLIAALDPATVRELVRLARIGERHETRPDPLGDAMNSGDGVYRP